MERVAALSLMTSYVSPAERKELMPLFEGAMAKAFENQSEKDIAKSII